MPDHVIDTNVLLVASAHDSGSPFEDSDVPSAYRQTVLDWLVTFRGDAARNVIIDGRWTIWNEYRGKLGDQDLGLMVVTEKLQWARFVEIEYDEYDNARLPAELAVVVHDLSDRKFVAVALADGGRSTIVNASDTDWYGWEPSLAASGVAVEQIIDEWCRPKHQAKSAR